MSMRVNSKRAHQVRPPAPSIPPGPIVSPKYSRPFDSGPRAGSQAILLNGIDAYTRAQKAVIRPHVMSR
jgi:hypothetical protein